MDLSLFFKRMELPCICHQCRVAVAGRGERECKGHVASWGGVGRPKKQWPRCLVFLPAAYVLDFQWQRWRLELCFWVWVPNKREINITGAHHE